MHSRVASWRTMSSTWFEEVATMVWFVDFRDIVVYHKWKGQPLSRLVQVRGISIGKTGIIPRIVGLIHSEMHRDRISPCMYYVEPSSSWLTTLIFPSRLRMLILVHNLSALSGYLFHLHIHFFGPCAKPGDISYFDSFYRFLFHSLVSNLHHFTWSHVYVQVRLHIYYLSERCDLLACHCRHAFLDKCQLHPLCMREKKGGPSRLLVHTSYIENYWHWNHSLICSIIYSVFH